MRPAIAKKHQSRESGACVNLRFCNEKGRAAITGAPLAGENADSSIIPISPSASRLDVGIAPCVVAKQRNLREPTATPALRDDLAIADVALREKIVTETHHEPADGIESRIVMEDIVVVAEIAMAVARPIAVAEVRPAIVTRHAAAPVIPPVMATIVAAVVITMAVAAVIMTPVVAPIITPLIATSLAVRRPAIAASVGPSLVAAAFSVRLTSVCASVRAPLVAASVPVSFSAIATAVRAPVVAASVPVSLSPIAAPVRATFIAATLAICAPAVAAFVGDGPAPALLDDALIAWIDVAGAAPVAPPAFPALVSAFGAPLLAPIVLRQRRDLERLHCFDGVVIVRVRALLNCSR